MTTIASARRRSFVRTYGSLLIAVVVIASASAADRFVVVTPERIMALGDSITRGTGSAWGDGFRLPLVKRMVVGRYTSDMVGAVNSGPPWLYDRHHDGFGGYGIDDIMNVVATDLNAFRPDYVLLMIGSNDVQSNFHLDTAPDRLNALIDRITDTRPTAKVIVASITPLSNPVMDANARLYNAAIPGIVQAQADAGKHVSFVDMYPLLTLADLSDGVHPNDGGYAKLAAAWAAKLAELRSAPPPISTRSCPCSIWDPSDAPATQQVGTTTSAEVGVKFRAEKDGFITGIRFYKGPDNAGPHVASLWKAISDSSTYTPSSTTISGTLLAQGTVTSGSDPGWQDVVFATPVPVQAHALYFASYYAPFGKYAADVGYFRDREIVHSPLRLPSQSSMNGNGFIKVGGQGLPSLPSPTLDTNYWVDVVFVPIQPLKPATVTVTAVSASAIDVSWGAVADATGYRLERSSDDANWSTLASVATGITSYRDTELAPATTYYYRVIAISNGIESAPSGSASATTKPLPPESPSSVTASAVSTSQIDVAWSTVTNATGYRVERSTDGSTWGAVTITSSGVTTYSNTGLQPATTYSYRVIATNAGGDSPPSPVATATTVSLPPSAPASVTATAVSSTQINVAWSAVTNATGYRVERSTDGTTWGAVTTTSSGVTTYSNTGLQPATTYSYRVIATNAGGDSPPSLVASATTHALADTVAPTAPTLLKAASPKGKINLSWTGSTDAGGSGLAGYKVWRSTSASGVFATIATITAASTSYTDAAVTANLTYWYRLTAFDGAGNESQPSNTTSGTPK
jgi:fibronectin type 3 domain-containing protein/lysophospholipase L1-like esterase